jgi:hypothetical protein
MDPALDPRIVCTVQYSYVIKVAISRDFLQDLMGFELPRPYNILSQNTTKRNAKENKVNFLGGPRFGLERDSVTRMIFFWKV